MTDNILLRLDNAILIAALACVVCGWWTLAAVVLVISASISIYELIVLLRGPAKAQ